MLPRVAPSALRMPISRVRSVTVTSMMFMMPMPPTTRLTPAMPASRKPRISVVCCWVARNCLRSMIEKSLSAPGASPCLRRITRSTSTIALASSVPGATCTAIDCSLSSPVTR